MFKFNKNNKLVKKVLVSGAALLMLAGVGAGVSNVNIHASGFNMAQLVSAYKKSNVDKEDGTGKYEATSTRAKVNGKQLRAAHKDFAKGMVLNTNKPAPNPCRVRFHSHKAHRVYRHVAHKARKARVRKHFARRTRRAKRNTRGYRNYEVKNLSITLNRLDKKAQHSHGRKRARLIRNMRHVNGLLGKLVGRKGKKTTRGYKNYEVKNIARTLNRVDAKVSKSHGRKYAKLIRTLKSANYILIQLAK